jgi:hypothetical protein
MRGMKREHPNTHCLRGLIVTALLSTAIACGGGPEGTNTTSAAGGSIATNTSSSSADSWKPTIKTATLPADPCELISAADVEAVMGSKVVEPPKKADGCLYVLAIPEAVAAKRAQAKEMQEKIRNAFAKLGTPPEEPQGVMANAMNDPRSYAVTVSVDVRGEVTGEIGVDAALKQLGFAKDAPGASPTEGAKAANDWDDARRISNVFMGRVGHVQVNVEAQSPDVPKELLPKLAEVVRDKIPDLPFGVTNPYQVMQLGPDKDPCSLLTRAEAETVLGPLAMDPFRASSNWPPLAHGKGYACAYYTAGHHVFALAPEWQGGAQSFKIEKGVGGLVGLVAPQESVVIKGPWEQTSAAGSGALLFLKGDQLLEVHYRTSRATRADAIKLAAIAMPRLAP